MARITVEDCIEKVEDRFELVAIASQRAKDIASGSPLTIERNGEKNTVIALREIAQGNVDVQDLREGLEKSFQTERLAEEFSEDVVEEEAELSEAALVEVAGEEDALADEDAEGDAAVAEELSFAEDNVVVDD